MGKFPVSVLSTFCFLILFETACTQQQNKAERQSFPAGYNVQNHQKFRLSEDLDEISGIAFDQKQNRILAIQDEDGRVYHIDPQNGDEIADFRFGKSGDYEDIAQTPEGWFYLKSNGNLYFAGDSVDHPFESEKIDYPRKDDEFEGLYYDPQRKMLMLVCKQCDLDKKGSPGVYGYSPATRRFSDQAVFTLSKAELNGKLAKPVKDFRPSAAAIHPLQKKLYVLASQQKLLVIASPDGRIEQAFRLDKKIFKQAEGICFKPNGDMFISNEAAQGYANILYFPYKP